MVFILIRIFFFLLALFTGMFFAPKLNFPHANIAGIVIAAGIALLIILFEFLAKKVSLRGLSSALFGLLLGILLAKFLSYTLELFVDDEQIKLFSNTMVLLVLSYIGLTLGLKGKDDFRLVLPYIRFKRQDIKADLIVVDTSAIIDGRIVDVIKTRFIESTLVVPRFVLEELQKISDSTDVIKRQRGKRGLEILNELKNTEGVNFRIHQENIDEIKTVDAKLIKLAQLLEAKVLTTDYNLNRLAELEGVKVLNINDLANALKAIFLPGERFTLKLTKEGKEHNQAVGYLEDGTMVVVENARWMLQKTVTVEVVSVLQSPSGRIIFTKLAQESQ